MIMIDYLAIKMGELMYLRDNCQDYFIKRAYQRKINAIDELLKILPNEEKVIK